MVIVERDTIVSESSFLLSFKCFVQFLDNLGFRLFFEIIKFNDFLSCNFGYVNIIRHSDRVVNNCLVVIISYSCNFINGGPL